MSQTSVVAGGQPIGFAGQIADSGPHDIVSGFNLDTAQIPFGHGVMKSAAHPDGYVLPTGASGSMEVSGLSVFDLYHVRAGNIDPSGFYSGDLGASGLLPRASMQIGREGRYLAPVADNVANGDRPFCFVVATGTRSQGLWAGTNYGGSYVRDCTAQGVFRSSTYTAADGTTKVAVLELKTTNKPA